MQFLDYALKVKGMSLHFPLLLLCLLECGLWWLANVDHEEEITP